MAMVMATTYRRSQSAASLLPRLRRGLSSALSLDTINPAVRTAQYAVRGELVLRAAAIKDAKFAEQPYDKLLECNIGNPQAVGQSPVTFNRQVLSLLVHPEMADNPAAAALFAPDAIARAKEYLAAIPNGLGAYSESQGFAIVRQQVADFITARDDGVPAHKEDIFLTDGASKGVGFLLSLVLRGRSDGVLVPIPQYPLYSATLALQEAHMLGYELVEEEGWRLPIDLLEEKLTQAKADGVSTRALVVINPGNPTGNSLPLENMQEVLRFCGKHGLVLMADEVYQENIWEDARPFHSFKKVLCQMDDAPPVQLVSFHSTSKGFLGECGMRGGYFELCNFDAQVPLHALSLPTGTLPTGTLPTGTLPTGTLPPPSGPTRAHARSPPTARPPRPSPPRARAGAVGAAQARLDRLVLQYAWPGRDWLDGQAARGWRGVVRYLQRREGGDLVVDAPARDQARRRAERDGGRHVQRTGGRHVRLPLHHAAAQGGRGRRGGGKGARHLLRARAPRGDGHRRGAGLRLRPEAGHLALPHHLPAARGGHGRRDHTHGRVPQGLHGEVCMIAHCA